MKRVYITTVITSLLALVFFSFFYSFWTKRVAMEHLRIGFVYENDESTPYTYNFALAEEALREAYPGRIQIHSISNVPESETEEPIRELAGKGCQLIFTNSYSETFMELAREYPEMGFCQTSFLSVPPEDLPPNYHTFNGRIYEGRYVSGIVAGLKLKDLIDQHVIAPEEALVGYIAANDSASVLSGCSAFFLGIRSIVPEAVMHIRYTNEWDNYALEYAMAKELVNEGCCVISHHTDTVGAAIACEESSADHTVIFVGYNQSMLDLAPTTAIISTRINWTPYIVGAAGAVLENIPIERYVDGKAHGNDLCGGFDLGWVEMLDLNTHMAVDGTRQKINEVISSLKRGSRQVFKGSYTGINPADASDTVDLNQGYTENKEYSAPGFRYILKDVMIEDKAG
ncbi:MAG: BMP family ABC transporter substrate-binding protein [Blautia sp.]|nr:BMP family ABC transporter substrate-binding protein [Blautia sp.]